MMEGCLQPVMTKALRTIIIRKTPDLARSLCQLPHHWVWQLYRYFGQHSGKMYRDYPEVSQFGLQHRQHQRRGLPIPGVAA